MEKILVLDFGGQYNKLIARRVREAHVYAEIRSYDRITPGEIRGAGYRGIIFTGGPNSVYDPSSPQCDLQVLELGAPVLGICYGAQLLAYLSGGTVSAAENSSEYGKTRIWVKKHPLFQDVPEESICFMSHTDFISTPPEGFRVIAETEKCPCAALANDEKKLYGVQFHPEVAHTEFGREILRNFLFSIYCCKGDWDTADYAGKLITRYKTELAGKRVLLALSGGVDSSVAALLLYRAIGQNLICTFVDHGLLRKGEGDFVEKTFRETFGVNLIRINAEERFLKKLAGVTEPEAKRKIIGEEFVRVFEEEAGKIGHVHGLAQGTIYPDVIESGLGNSAVIKSHHNVGGLPAVVDFKEIIEPLRMLFKDEVRRAGLELGIPDQLVYRQPFPGPGLGVRIVGEVTEEKVRIVQDADAIYREEIAKAAEAWRRENAAGQVYKNAGISTKDAPRIDPPWMPSQYFAALTNMRSVGVMGDFRTYDYAVALRAVITSDFMTAECADIPFSVLQTAMRRIVNEVKGVNRVFYDLTSKPPGTIELE